MPSLISHQTDGVARLDDLVHACRSAAFDGGSPDGLAAVAPVLAALGNNRMFLADIALDALKENCRTQLATNSYSPQVILLHPPEGDFFLRANIWPSSREPAMRATGPAHFFYRVPHYHAFDFLTIGYFGPGYWSDYYEVEPQHVAGVPGEAIDLCFIERSQLSQGKMLLYRANRDIHDQMPPESLSVSINVMPVSQAQRTRRQYLFDVEAGRIIGCMAVTSAELMLRLSVAFGSGNGRDLAEDFLTGHPDPRMRVAAWAALDAGLDEDSARSALAERAMASGCPHLIRVGGHVLKSLHFGSDCAAQRGASALA